MVFEMDPDFFYKKASFLARLGSGSACRSIKGNLVQWGDHNEIIGSTNLYGIPYPYPVDEVFKSYQDTILLVHKGQKSVSSTVGHDLMHSHPFAQNRFVQAHDNLIRLRSIFAEGNLDDFIEVVESEALTLHAMMMTSIPYFILMKPNTLNIIEKIWEFRRARQNHLCFTLDAGANIHLLYPDNEKNEVNESEVANTNDISPIIKNDRDDLNIAASKNAAIPSIEPIDKGKSSIDNLIELSIRLVKISINLSRSPIILKFSVFCRFKLMLFFLTMFS